MNVLRRLPLSRLVLLCVALVALGTGVAVASSIGSGTPPPPATLADAIHRALSAAPVQGVTADVTFTNSLLQNGASAGGTPLLAGGSGRVWVTASGQARLELQSSGGDTEIYYANGTLSYYDPRNGGTLYRLVLPSRDATSGGSGSGSGDAQAHGAPTVAAIQSHLDRASGHASLSGAVPTVVAGQPAYEVRVSPSKDAGLFGGVALWWDANSGIPLRVAVYATGNPSPVLDLSATNVAYGPIDASVFAAPVAAKTETYDLSSHADHRRGAGQGNAGQTPTLSFTPSEPATLDGQTLTSKRVVDRGGHAAELLFYGHGLGGIAVLERAAPAGGGSTPAGGGSGQDGQSGPSLPTVDVNGVKATEIPTALGTLIEFTRGGVAYTVVGSVPTADAVRAATGL